MLQMVHLNKTVLRAQESRSCLAFFLESPAIWTEIVLDNKENEYLNAIDRSSFDALLQDNSVVRVGDA